MSAPDHNIQFSKITASTEVDRAEVMLAVWVVVLRECIEAPDPIEEGPAVVVGHGSNTRSHHHSATDQGLAESIIENLNAVAGHDLYPLPACLCGSRAVDLHHQRKPRHVAGDDRIFGIVSELQLEDILGAGL